MKDLQNDLTKSQKEAWEMFEKTGEISYYLKYKRSKEK